MAKHQATICIKDDGNTIRKITKIISYGAQGLGILMPYHKSASGIVMKLDVDYNMVGTFEVSRNDARQFSASSRVKLSYHSDGFAQFSGEQSGKIISGRDVQSGTIKGIGLQTSPLDDPIKTGPSFGTLVWGLQDFAVAHSEKNFIIFEKDDAYFRDSTPFTEPNGFLFEFFIFPPRFWAACRKFGVHYFIDMSLFNFETFGATVRMRVVPLVDQNLLIACLMSRAPVSFSPDSGWTLNGPGQRREDGKGSVLIAMYPNIHAVEGMESLDYLT